MTSRVLPHIPGVAAGLGRAGHTAPAVPCPTAHLKVSAALRRGWQARGTSHPPGVTPLVSPPWYGRRILREAPRAAGGARCHMRLPGADTGHLLRPLLSIAEFTTSPRSRLQARRRTSGSNRGCHASRRYCTAERRTRSLGRQPPPALSPADEQGTSILPPAGSCLLLSPSQEGQHPAPACQWQRDGAEPHGELPAQAGDTQLSARAGGSAVGKLPRDLALCFGDGLRAGAFQPGAEKVSGRS